MFVGDAKFEGMTGVTGKCRSVHLPSEEAGRD